MSRSIRSSGCSSSISIAVSSAVAATLLAAALPATVALASPVVLADQRCGLLPAECPAAFARLAAGARRDVPFAPADPAIAIPHFEDDRLEFRERAIGEHVRPDQGQTHSSAA